MLTNIRVFLSIISDKFINFVSKTNILSANFQINVDKIEHYLL